MPYTEEQYKAYREYTEEFFRTHTSCIGYLSMDDYLRWRDENWAKNGKQG